MVHGRRRDQGSASSTSPRSSTHLACHADHQAQLDRVAYECAIDLADDGVVYAEARFAARAPPATWRSASNSLPTLAVTAGLRRGKRDAADRPPIVVKRHPAAPMRTEHRVRSIRSSSGSTGFVSTTRRSSPSTSPAPRPGGLLRCTPIPLAFALSAHVNINVSMPPEPTRPRADRRRPRSTAPTGSVMACDFGCDCSRSATTTARWSSVRSPVTSSTTRSISRWRCCATSRSAPSSPSIEHPIAMFLRYGVDVGIHTDNRLMSDVMPSSELHDVADTFDLTWPEIERLVTNASTARLLPSVPGPASAPTSWSAPGSQHAVRADRPQLAGRVLSIDQIPATSEMGSSPSRTLPPGRPRVVRARADEIVDAWEPTEQHTVFTTDEQDGRGTASSSTAAPRSGASSRRRRSAPTVGWSAEVS